MKKLVIILALVLAITFSYGQEGILSVSSSNSQTSISFSLQKNTFVNLSVYNMKGQLITNLVSERKGPGDHRILWNWVDTNNKRVSSGVYLFKLTAGKYTSNGKIILMK